MKTGGSLRYGFFYPALQIGTAVLFAFIFCTITHAQFYPITITPKVGHQGSIWAVAYSPDGTRFASGSADKTIKIWSVADSRLVATLQGHAGDVRTVAFSPDGEVIASGSNDKTIKIWVKTKLFTTLKEHTGVITSVALSPDGNYLASAGSDSTIRLWSMKTCTRERILKGHTDIVSSVAFSPDGKKLVSGSYDKSVRIWSLREPNDTSVIEAHDHKVLSVLFSPDGKKVASGSYDGTIKLWNTENRRLIRIITTGRPVICCIAFSPDGNFLAAGDYSGHVKTWGLTGSGEYSSPDTGHAAFIASIAFSPDGKSIITGSKDSTIKFWAAPQPPLRGSILNYPGSIRSISYAPNSDPPLLASADGGSVVTVWSLTTGTIERSIETGGSCISVSLSKCGDTLAAGCGSFVKLFSVKNGAHLVTMEKHHFSTVNSVVVSPDYALVASECGDNTILVHTLTGRFVARLKMRFAEDKIASIVFPPKESNQLISGSSNGTISLWSISKQKQIRTTADSGSSGKVTSIAFSPDGSRYAYATAAGGLQIRSFPGDSIIRRSPKRSKGITSLRFSDDGSLLAAGNLDGTITFRTAVDFREVTTLKGGDKSAIWSLAFVGNDPALLVSGGGNRSIRYWGTEDSTWLLTSSQFAEKEYLTYTRDGYFVSSDPVRNNLAKYIDCSTDDSGFTMNDYGMDFYRPTVIDSLLDRGIGRNEKGPGSYADAGNPVPLQTGRPGKKYAIIIGIADYRELRPNEPGNDLTDLKYSGRDAEAFRKFLEDTARSGGGWNIRYMVNDSATKTNMDNAITPILENAKENDIIYIFFSGHGRSHRDKPDDVYLLTWDFQLSDYRSGFAYDDLLELIKECRAGHVVAFIDACKSGTIGFKGGNPEALFDQDALYRKMGTIRDNRIIFTSAKGTQVSWEDDEFRMGTFSYFLIKGLNGCADEYADPHHVNLNELEEYVADNVRKRTRNRSLQTPDVREADGNTEYMLPLANRIQGDFECEQKKKPPVNASR